MTTELARRELVVTRVLEPAVGWCDCWACARWWRRHVPVGVPVAGWEERRDHRWLALWGEARVRWPSCTWCCRGAGGEPSTWRRAAHEAWKNRRRARWVVRVFTREYERGVAWPAPFRAGGVGRMPEWRSPAGSAVEG